jgi:hypothetical protein
MFEDLWKMLNGLCVNLGWKKTGVKLKEKNPEPRLRQKEEYISVILG